MNHNSDITEEKPGMVTVIVPVYNGAKYIAKCLDSVLQQHYEYFQIVVVDDGSKDNSAEICKDYGSRDKRIKLVQTENNGPGAARNAGLNHASGDWIFFLDVDDTLKPDSLSLLIDGHKRSSADIIVGDFNRINVLNNNTEYHCNAAITESQLFNRLEIIKQAGHYFKKPNKNLLFAYSWGRLFKRAIIEDNTIRFNHTISTYEDVDFNFEYLKYANSLYFVKAPVYNYLIHGHFSSATMDLGNNPERMFGYIAALSKARGFIESCNIDMSKELGHAYITLTIVQFVRSCGQINRHNRQSIHALFHKVINTPEIRNSLTHYSPSKDESKIIPLLIKYKLVKMIIWVCRYKARKRYGKKGN